MRKPLIIIITLLVLAISAIFFISMQRNTAVIIVNVTLAEPSDNNSGHIISHVDASLSYARKMEVPEGTSLASPGITVLLIQDMQVRSNWYSISIPASRIYGNYTIKVKPYGTLNLTYPLVVLTRVMDPTGKEVSVRRTEHKVS